MTLDLDYEMIMQLVDKFTQKSNLYRAQYHNDHLYFVKQGGYEVLNEIRNFYGTDALIRLLSNNKIYYDYPGMDAMGQFHGTASTEHYMTPLTHAFNIIKLRYKTFRKTNKRHLGCCSDYATSIVRHELSHSLSGILFLNCYEAPDGFPNSALCEGLTELSVLKLHEEDWKYISGNKVDNYRVHVIRTYESMMLLSENENIPVGDLFFKLSINNFDRSERYRLSESLDQMYDFFEACSKYSQSCDEFWAEPLSEVNTLGCVADKQSINDAFDIIREKWKSTKCDWRCCSLNKDIFG